MYPLAINPPPIGQTSMDRFLREPYDDGDAVKILSTCVLCGARLIGSTYDETLQGEESRHRTTCGNFMHSLSAGGTVVHSTCLKCGLLMQAKLGYSLQQMEEEHLRGCTRRFDVGRA